ncbi:hypothetical protein [Nostoc commune]|uniref:hypothetical protein n=1 Tax=Nostoc commune TaxID=1178 RepID=UPI0018C7A334|nr:hypothetical protein [Nostoc commune]MBG1263738.1 hypothetical protein [Nostoc commune BAE]
MELFLQFGHGMMEHCYNLIQDWGSGTVILSPRDLKPEQLQTFANKINNLGGSILLDSQFYLPYGDHEKLQSHTYWPKTYTSVDFWSGSGLKELLTKVLILNRQLKCINFILPGLYAETIDDDWLIRQSDVVKTAQELEHNPLELIATVALSADATRNVDQIHELLENAKGWSVSGIYLICEHPKSQYLVDDPLWLANVLDLIAGFRLSGKKVIVGYCSHQMLIAGCASANAIASGTFLNVRSFTPVKFQAPLPGDIKQKSIWYYCPQALSEFTLPYLDLAHRQGVLSDMKSSEIISGKYANILFGSVLPNSTGFGEREAFRHYLQSLRSQTLVSRQNSFNDSITLHENLLNSAEQLLQKLSEAGINTRERGFEKAINANRGALKFLENTYSSILKRYWNKI